MKIKLLTLANTFSATILAGISVSHAEPNPFPPPIVPPLVVAPPVDKAAKPTPLPPREEEKMVYSSLAPPGGSVTPAEVELTIEPGESEIVNKTVTLPEVPPKLDLVLMVDLSGSYWDDLSQIQSLAPDIFTNIRSVVSDSQFGLATFVDFPFSPWGEPTGDYAYHLNQDLTNDMGTWLDAISSMNIYYGYDEPESQNEALYQAATGLGREMPITLNGNYSDLGEIEPGQAPSFRDGATHIIALTTDASFHQGDDSGDFFPYPGATDAQAISALQAANIKVVAIKAPGATMQMDAVAAATGGAVVSTGSSSAEIAEAILSGIQALTFNVYAQPDSSCAPLQFSYVPPSYSDISGGTSVSFEETITVPSGVTEADLGGDGRVDCQVNFFADSTLIGTQTVHVIVPLNRPPVAQCHDLTLSADAACMAVGDINAGSYDPDGDLISLSYSPPGPYPLGNTFVTLTVTDPSGASSNCTALVTVKDTTPPVVTVNPTMMLLWPPNHDYRSLNLGQSCGVQAVDNCGGTLALSTSATIKKIYSDEPEDAKGNGDGKTTADILPINTIEFKARAERAGSGNGRVYGVTFDVKDTSGNSTVSNCYIGIPHSQNGTLPVDDGPGAGYIVTP